MDHIVLSPARATITAGGSRPTRPRARPVQQLAGRRDRRDHVLDRPERLLHRRQPAPPRRRGRTLSRARRPARPAPRPCTVTTGAGRPHRDQPRERTIIAGGSQTYTAEGFEPSNNSLGDVTATTTFTIAPNGSCTRQRAPRPPPARTRSPAPTPARSAPPAERERRARLDHIVLSPASATITSGGSQAYTAEGLRRRQQLARRRHRLDHLLDRPDGSCTGASCTATVAGPHTVTGTKPARPAPPRSRSTPGGLDHSCSRPPRRPSPPAVRRPTPPRASMPRTTRSAT